MPPRDPSLPEGTDRIIDTNIDLGDNGSSGGGGGGGSGAGETSEGSGGKGPAFKFDKEGGDSSGSGGITGQIREQISNLKSQAGDRARSLADDGKKQTSDFLQTMAQIVNDAASSVEERLGSQYSGFGRKASDSIQSLADGLDRRSVDDLVDEARDFVHRSPAIAIGIAAVVGFAVARVIRSSVAEWSNSAEDEATGSNSGGSSSGRSSGSNKGAKGGGNAAMGSAGTSSAGAA